MSGELVSARAVRAGRQWAWRLRANRLRCRIRPRSPPAGGV